MITFRALRTGEREEEAMPKANGKSGGGAPNTKALEKAVQKAILAVRTAKNALEGEDLESLTPDGRLYSSGKLREGEEVAMTAILDTVDEHPGLFASLAAHDHGKDDKVVETGPARGALARRALLAPLAKELEDLLTRVSDDMIGSGELAKDVTIPAYAIIKANVDMSPSVRKSAAPAIGFYAKTAKKKAPKKAPAAPTG
ncbi:MAG: hypothetical protein QM820_54160 [Minicystis sp.]